MRRCLGHTRLPPLSGSCRRRTVEWTKQAVTTMTPLRAQERSVESLVQQCAHTHLPAHMATRLLRWWRWRLMMKEIQHTHATLACRPALAHGYRRQEAASCFAPREYWTHWQAVALLQPHRLGRSLSKNSKSTAPLHQFEHSANTLASGIFLLLRSWFFTDTNPHKTPRNTTPQKRTAQGTGPGESAHDVENPGEIPTKSFYARNDDPHTIFSRTMKLNWKVREPSFWQQRCRRSICWNL